MPSYEKRSDKWSVRFRHNGQNKRLSGYRTKAEATKAYAEYIARTPTYNRATDAYEIEKFDDLLVMYLDRQRDRVKASTFSYQSPIYDEILDWFSEKRLRDITRADCERWAENLDGKPSSKRLKKTILNGIFAFMERECDIPNPLRRADIQFRDDEVSEKAVITAEQYGIFRSTVREDTRVIFDLLFFTGARVGEILALTEDDIHPCFVVINKQKDVYGRITTTKTKSSNRKVSVPRWVYDEAVAEQVNISSAYRTKLRRTFEDAKKKMGLPKEFTIHSLRHSHVSILLSNGVPITAISKRIGHSNPEITMRVYAHMIPDDESVISNALNQINIKLGTDLGTEFH